MGIFALAALLVFAACKKATPPETENSPVVATTLPMPAAPTAKRALMLAEMRKLDALIDAELRLADKNRRLMVSPAPADFRPDAAARKIKLTLVLEKTKVRVGEDPRFRLELTNIGREPIDYIEYESSVFRWGGIWESIKTIDFIMIDEKGRRLKLEPPMGGRTEPMKPLSGPLTAEEEAESKASTIFRVKILPGETLRSLGDGNSPTEPFRTMLLRKDFKTAGRKKIHVELDDQPGPLTDRYIKMVSTFETLEETRKDWAQREADALGPVSSNSVVLEVAR